MSNKAMTKEQEAIEFLGSMRGQYIMGQALQLAINALESVEPEVMRERSNIKDMEFLRDELFPMGGVVAALEKAKKKMNQEFFDLYEVKKEEA